MPSRFIPGLTILLILTLFACTNTTTSEREAFFNSITDTAALSAFPEKEKMEFRTTGIQGQDVMTMTVVDTFLLLANQHDSDVLQIIGTGSNKLLATIIPRGTSKGRCLNVASIVPTDSNDIVWLYDVTSVKLLKIDLQKAVKEKNYTPEKEYTATSPTMAVKSPCWIDDSTFAGCSYFADDSRFVFFNDNFRVTKKIGQLPPSQRGWPDENPKGKFGLLAMCYTGLLIRHPQEELFALAYNKASRLEFYTGEKLIKIVRGPDLFDPIYEFQDYNGVHVPKENENTMYAFSAIQYDKENIYLLYSGRKSNPTGQQIHVFDWEGRPVKILELGADYRIFTLFKRGGHTDIYAINNTTGDIEVSDITM